MNLLKPEEISVKLGLTKAALPAPRRQEKAFPQPIRVSQKALRWDEAEIDAWAYKRKEAENG